MTWAPVGQRRGPDVKFAAQSFTVTVAYSSRPIGE
jgi:hypothetical protein